MAIRKAAEGVPIVEDYIAPVVKYLNEDERGLGKRLDIVKRLKTGTQYFTCYLCGRTLEKNEFYASNDTRSYRRVSRVCRRCVEEIAMPKDPETGETK